MIESLFGVPRALIGVIHAQALPGTPANRLGVSAIAELAAAEAEVYAAAGFHGVLLENTHDRPYVKGAAVGVEITFQVCDARPAALPVRTGRLDKGHPG